MATGDNSAPEIVNHSRSLVSVVDSLHCDVESSRVRAVTLPCGVLVVAKRPRSLAFVGDGFDCSVVTYRKHVPTRD